MKISIIIPIINEESTIRDRLLRLQAFRREGHEVIVVDGGSEDSSYELAAKGADRVVSAKKGRARQMNAGARFATGELLLFLHIDTDLPENIAEVLRKAVKDNIRTWGRFNVRLSGKHFMFRIIETTMNWRSRLTGIATGDQAIFITKTLFDEVGGFPEIRLMEDIEISARLKKLAKPVCLQERVTTSSRRWESSGIFATILLMWRLRLAYWLGVDPGRLVQRYYQ